MIKKQVDLGKSLNRLKRHFDTRIEKNKKIIPNKIDGTILQI